MPGASLLLLLAPWLTRPGFLETSTLTASSPLSRCAPSHLNHAGTVLMVPSKCCMRLRRDRLSHLPCHLPLSGHMRVPFQTATIAFATTSAACSKGRLLPLRLQHLLLSDILYCGNAGCAAAGQLEGHLGQQQCSPVLQVLAGQCN